MCGRDAAQLVQAQLDAIRGQLLAEQRLPLDRRDSHREQLLANWERRYESALAYHQRRL